MTSLLQLWKRGSKITQRKTLSAIDKRLKEEKTIYSKKNTKKQRITLKNILEMSKRLNTN